MSRSCVVLLALRAADGGEGKGMERKREQDRAVGSGRRDEMGREPAA